MRFREPVYLTIRELVTSYNEHYYNRMNWMTEDDDLLEVCEYFCAVPHSLVMPPQVERMRRRRDRRPYETRMVGEVK